MCVNFRLATPRASRQSAVCSVNRGGCVHSSASQYVRVQCASECSAISVQCASVCIRCTVVPLCFCRSPRVRLCKSHRRHPPRLPAGLNHTRQNTLNNQISPHWDAAGPTEKSAHCEDLEKCHLIGRAQSGLAVSAESGTRNPAGGRPTRTMSTTGPSNTACTI